jgi:3'-phosphoadenosine 5'-phosphosulfate (PAPS) 3'-phosphatase
MSSVVNLLDLAAASLASTIVASKTIRQMSKTPEEVTGAASINSRLKEDGSIVTDADLAAQGVIFSAIRAVSADVKIVGEESEEEMMGHSVTGHEEATRHMYELAREEIRIRYDQVNEKSPLAAPGQEETTNDTTETETVRSDLQVLEECEVSVDRVVVFIDPLDGTKSFAKGDYAPVSILIAIILDSIPCFGVICKPFGHDGQPSILDTPCVGIYGGTLLGAIYTAGGGRCKIPSTDALPRAVISSSRSKGVVQDFVELLGSKGMIDSEALMVTGAGEKSLRIILRRQNEGVWFFPKPGTSLWDVAASDALLRAIGGKLTDKFGKDMDYSKSRTEAENLNGLIACYDAKLHAECLRLYSEYSLALSPH